MKPNEFATWLSGYLEGRHEELRAQEVLAIREKLTATLRRMRLESMTHLVYDGEPTLQEIKCPSH